MAEMGAAENGVYQVGWGCPYLGPYLLGGGSVGHALRVGDVCHDTLYLEGFEQIPPQGSPQADGEATLESMGRSMGISPSWGRNGRGGISGSGDLRLPAP